MITAAASSWTLADTEQSIPRRFSEHARRHAHKVAIAGTAWQPTFEELDEAAGGIASALTEHDGAGTGAGRVALLMNHDAPLIAATLGVLKAGQAVVVMNPGDPPGRLDRIRRQVEPWLAVVDAPHRELARRAGFDQILEVPGPSGGPSDATSFPPPAADHLAAVMFTSGSTGRPKGVKHTHHTVLHTALRHSTALGLTCDDRVALLASPSGGHGMGTTWMTLLSGATLCPFPVMDLGVAGLPRWLREHRITVMGLSASLFRRFLGAVDGDAFPDLRLVRLGSEQVRRADFDHCRRHFGEQCSFANVFSLTEAGGLAHNVISAGETPPPGPLPAGRAAQGIEILLLDERGDPVQPGEAGEIVARSRHLSPGYYGDETLTAERFSPSGRTGERTLRTGDLGHLDEDGKLVVLGRRDAQVKIRGFRVELAEVEAGLRSLPGVESAAARAEPTRRGDSRLVGYVVPDGDATLAPADLRHALRANLPDASIPTAFAFVDELPLNAHGKVDRERLSSLSPPASAAGAPAPPASALERKLSEIWAVALELDAVGRDDDFFDLAGDSLAAAEIGAGIYAALGVEIDMRAFARHPTVARMAGLIDRSERRMATDASRIACVPRDGPIPCTFAQERIWHGAHTSGYTVASITGLDSTVDLEAFRAALEQVTARHEPLRTTFTEHGGRPLQVIHPAMPIDFATSDVSGSSDPEEQVLELLEQETAVPFDLERGPLLRFRLIRVRGGEHRLLRVSHHLLTDRGSWRIFFDELAHVYEAVRLGQRAPEPDPGRLQYADFAAWERRRDRADPTLYRRQRSWWRGALERVPPTLELPFARQAPASGVPPREGTIWWGVDPAAIESLDRLGREGGATHYAVRLAVFSALLALETGQDEVTVGTYADTRRLPETHSMFGYFANLVPLILPFDPRATLRSWLAKVRFILVETIARSDLPYQLVCEELLISGRVPPEINAIFSVRYPMPELSFGTAEIPTAGSLVSMPWGFSFSVDQHKESSLCQVDFDANLYDPVAVRGFIGRYAALAEAAGAHPDRRLEDLHAELL